MLTFYSSHHKTAGPQRYFHNRDDPGGAVNAPTTGNDEDMFLRLEILFFVAQLLR